MEKLLKFVAENADKDTSRLILDRGKYPDVDIDLAVNCIESRRKLKGKVAEWYKEAGLIFPLKLSAEQCSSSATGKYKAELAEYIASWNSEGSNISRSWKIADLTGGLGVDSWFFSQKASVVIYNEMQTVLCDAARHNFKVLEADNIEIRNFTVTDENIESLAGDQSDIIYIDPARRGEGGKKVFLIEDCTPDVMTLKDRIFSFCRHILIKLSPMADITMVCESLGHTCRQVHIVSSGGECKELLVWMDREWNEEYEIVAVELHNDSPASTFSFRPSEEKSAPYRGIMADRPENITGTYLFEPGKSLMKSGAFNLLADRFGITKFGRSTHYYLTDSTEKADQLKSYGKIYIVSQCLSLDKKNIKETGRRFPKAEVSARNIPMDTDTLRKKLCVTSGDDAHIFGLKSDSLGNLLIAARRLY